MVLLRQAAAPQDADSKSEMSVLHELGKRSYFYICNNTFILNQWHGVSIHTADLMKVVLGCGKFDGLQELFTWCILHNIA